MQIGFGFSAILLDLEVSHFTRCLTFAPHLAFIYCMSHVPIAHPALLLRDQRHMNSHQLVIGNYFYHSCLTPKMITIKSKTLQLYVVKSAPLVPAV